MRGSFGPSPETGYLNRETNREEEARSAELLLRLEPLLIKESENLREEGFPVNNNCQIDPEKFRDIFDARNIERDNRMAANYLHGRNEPTKSGEALPKLLEATTVLAVNSALFDQRLAALRTADLDDYHHGVDYLIIDRESGQVLAAADATIAPEAKAAKLQQNITEGMSVRYGVALGKNGVNRGPLEHLPYFIINIKSEDVVALAEELVDSGDKGPVAKRVETQLLKTLAEQATRFGALSKSELRAAYAAAAKIFEEMKADVAAEKR
ncbi:MAG: hypothetical protein AAB759_03105 [Patescibacteria group bacterium]